MVIVRVRREEAVLRRSRKDPRRTSPVTYTESFTGKIIIFRRFCKKRFQKFPKLSFRVSQGHERSRLDKHVLKNIFKCSKS